MNIEGFSKMNKLSFSMLLSKLMYKISLIKIRAPNDNLIHSFIAICLSL